MHAMRSGCALTLALAVGARAQSAYLRDYEVLGATIRRQAAALAWRRIDWPQASKALEPRFTSCRDDVTHVRNCMELIALLGDGHSGVRSHKVDAAALPSKFDGLYG